MDRHVIGEWIEHLLAHARAGRGTVDFDPATQVSSTNLDPHHVDFEQNEQLPHNSPRLLL